MGDVFSLAVSHLGRGGRVTRSVWKAADPALYIQRDRGSGLAVINGFVVWHPAPEDIIASDWEAADDESFCEKHASHPGAGQRCLECAADKLFQENEQKRSAESAEDKRKREHSGEHDRTS